MEETKLLIPQRWSMQDKIRNAVVAAGAILGLSEIQWKSLLKGFLQKEIGG